MITKQSHLKYFILRPGVAMPTLGTNVYDFTTDQSNINLGVGGFYKPVVNSGNKIEINNAPGNNMQFIFRRDTSGDRLPQYEYHIKRSEIINGYCRNGIHVTGKAASSPVNNSWLFGDVLTGTNQIPLLEEFEYKWQVSAHGDRTDLTFGNYNTPTTFAYYNSPDWSLTSFTAAQQLDITVSSLAENFNRQATGFYSGVAVCIESAGTSAGANVLTIESLAGLGATPVALGTNVVIGYQGLNGETDTLTMTPSVQAAFAELQATLVSLGLTGATLKPYYLQGTPNVTTTVPVAGTTGTADHIYVLALDEALAYYDFKVNTKRRLTVGLVEGFDNVSPIQISEPNEGSGVSRQIEIEYRNHDTYRDIARNNPAGSYSVEFPTELLKDASYDQFIISHCANRTATSGLPSNNNYTTIICVVSFEDPNTPYFEQAGAGNPNPQKTYIQNAINAFISDNNLQIPAINV